jgi:hypothetical protein
MRGRLLLAMSAHAGLDSECVFDQTSRLCVLVEESPGFGSGVFCSGHFVSFCTDSRPAPCFLGFLPKFVPRFPLWPYFLT